MDTSENTDVGHQINKNEKRRRAARGAPSPFRFDENVVKQQQCLPLLLLFSLKRKKNISQGCVALVLPLTVIFFMLFVLFEFDVFTKHKFYLF